MNDRVPESVWDKLDKLPRYGWAENQRTAISAYEATVIRNHGNHRVNEPPRERRGDVLFYVLVALIVTGIYALGAVTGYVAALCGL